MSVYWIGGSPCAGKTTISNIIAQEFGWHVYSLDRHVETYLKRANPEQHPYLSSYKNMGLKKFLLQPAKQQLEQVLGISREQFAFILDDIKALQEDLGEKPILVEGSNMLVSQITPILKTPNHAIWIVPTEAFQLETYPKRGSWVQEVLRQYDQSEDAILAFDRWMERDAEMARLTAKQARENDIPIIVVDGETSLLDNAEIVMKHFNLLTFGASLMCCQEFKMVQDVVFGENHAKFRIKTYAVILFGLSRTFSN